MRTTRWTLLLLLTMAACRPETGPPARAARWLLGAEVARSAHDLRGSALETNSGSCGFPLRLVAVMPDPVLVPDRRGEWVELQHQEVESVDLTGWVLESGGRRRALPSTLLHPHSPYRVGGGPRPLAPVRLRNLGGRVTLLDPCGLESSTLAWGSNHGVRLRPGEQLRREALPVQNARTPPETSQAGSLWWLRMDLNHRPNDYESFALTPELRSRWGEHLASRGRDRQPRMVNNLLRRPVRPLRPENPRGLPAGNRPLG